MLTAEPVENRGHSNPCPVLATGAERLRPRAGATSILMMKERGAARRLLKRSGRVRWLASTLFAGSRILNTISHLVIAGLRGNAGAGGAMLARAADRIYSASGVVLNPHYRGMGELYGSEYWTYLLPMRVGQARALKLTQVCQPIGARAARDIGGIRRRRAKL
jgi:enoyl-CoA hydratase/carnithine racemase